MENNTIQKLINEKKYFEIRKYLNNLNIQFQPKKLNKILCLFHRWQNDSDMVHSHRFHQYILPCFFLINFMDIPHKNIDLFFKSKKCSKSPCTYIIAFFLEIKNDFLLTLVASFICLIDFLVNYLYNKCISFIKTLFYIGFSNFAGILHIKKVFPGG